MSVHLDQPYSYRDYLSGERGRQSQSWEPAACNGGVGILKQVVNAIAELSSGGTDGFTIGVFGGWGAGKTSLLRGLEYYYGQMLGMPVLFFEAWRYQNEPNPLIPLIVRLSEQIPDKDKDDRDLLLRLGRALAVASTDIVLSHLSGGRVAFSDLRSYWEFADTKGREALDRTVLYDQTQRALASTVSQMLKGREEGARLFLIVDDLDRCLPDKACAMLEALRFFFTIERTTVILGMDDAIVSQYLEEQFGKGSKSFFRGKDFLEKLVTWSVELPRVRADVACACYLHMPVASEVEGLFGAAEALSYRTWKRVANRYQLALTRGVQPLAAALFALIEECFPGLERELRSQPQVRTMLETNPSLLGLEELHEDLKFLAENDKIAIGAFGERGPEVLQRVRQYLRGVKIK